MHVLDCMTDNYNFYIIIGMVRQRCIHAFESPSCTSVYTGQTIVDPKQLMKDLKLEVADIKGAHACMLHRFCAAVHELAHLFTLRYKYCQVMCAWQMDCLWHACMNCMHAYTMHYINYNRGPGECAVERVRKYSAQWILPSGLAQRQGLL